MRYKIYQDVFTNMFYAELWGGEFANCYGQGHTPDQAIRGLKIRVYQLRKAKPNPKFCSDSPRSLCN